jgi:hypothetical protein
MARAVSATPIQSQILAQIALLSGQITAQGVEYATQIKLLRSELGMNGDTAHGRLPILEAMAKSHELTAEKIDIRVQRLEVRGNEMTGADRLKQSLLSVVVSSLSATLIGLLFHWLGKG